MSFSTQRNVYRRVKDSCFQITYLLDSIQLHAATQTQSQAAFSRDMNPSPQRAACRCCAHVKEQLYLLCTVFIRHQSMCSHYLIVASLISHSLSDNCIKHTALSIRALFLSFPMMYRPSCFTLGCLAHLCRNIVAPPMGQCRNYRNDTFHSFTLFFW